MVDERHLNGTTGESKSYTVTNNGNAYSTARNLYYEQLEDAEPTEEQVKEYCRKRCLVIVTSELFNEMKARWSAEPVRHGRWIVEEWINTIFCSECGNSWHIMDNDTETFNYCPNCGAKMQE